MSDVRIRRASADDAEELAAVYRSAYRENRELGFPAKAGSATPSEVADWIRDRRVYVAEIEDEIVGGVRLEAAEPPETAERPEATERPESADQLEAGERPEATDSDCVKLSRLGVHESWKGEGVGSRLLDHAEDAVRYCGYEAIWLTTPGEHPYLPDLYRRRGYEKTGPYPLDFRQYDETVMEKQLR